MLSIQNYIPKKLSPFIQSFWYLKVSEDLQDAYEEQILPDGHHEIIFQLNSSPARKRTGCDDWTNDPAVFFAGQNRRSYTQRLDPGAVIYAVRFQPHTQALFYDFPAALSTDSLLAFSDVASNDILPDCISGSPEKTFANLEKELLKKASRLKNQGDTFLYVDAAIRVIIAQKGNVKVGFLEKITGVSTRHLEKAFQKFVGVGPKQFCNLVRYNHFVTYRKQHPEKTLTECAHEAGFHDQSHLIHLSRLITGQSPKAYFDQMNYINNFFL